MIDKLMVFMLMLVVSLTSSLFFTSAISGIYELNPKATIVCFMFIAVIMLLLVAVIYSITNRIVKALLDRQKCQ